MKRLLLIEDEPGLVLTLVDRLGREGYSVASAQDGVTGLERAQQEAFDLILLDVMLPKQNGFDVLRDLRLQGVDTPVISSATWVAGSRSVCGPAVTPSPRAGRPRERRPCRPGR